MKPLVATPCGSILEKRTENDNVRVTLVHGNWEQDRSRPDGPTRVLLAVIAKHPEAVEDVLRKAS